MLQLVSGRPAPPSRRGNRLTDPDILLRIGNRPEDGADNGTSPDEFGMVLADLRMAGTWKRTNHGRLKCAQDMVCKFLQPPHDGEIRVLDLGASEGLTTLELASALRDRFGERAHAVMADLHLWLLRYRKGPICEYRAPDGEPIMVKFGRVGVRLSRPRHDQPQSADPIGALYLRCRSFRGSMPLDARISLVHPLVRENSMVSIVELDCLVRDETLASRFHAIRASNILNAGYFNTSQIRTAIANVHTYLADGGCLVVSRNRDDASGESESGSGWRKAGSGFSHLADFGSGSEMRLEIDRWRSA